MKHFLSLLTMLLFFTVMVYSQVEGNSKNKTVKNSSLNSFENFYSLSEKYCEIDSARAYKYANKALQIAKKNNSLKQKVFCYERISKIAITHNDIRKQIAFADSCFVVANTSKDDELLAHANYVQAYKYSAVGEKEKFIATMLKALAFFEKEKKDYHKMVSGYGNLSLYFKNQGNIIGQKKYATIALALAKESKNNDHIAQALNIWATLLYHEVNMNQPDPILLDSATNCYLKAIHLLENGGVENIKSFEYAKYHLNLSNLYVNFFSDTRRAKTIAYLDKSESICIKINDPEILMAMYGQKVQFNINTKNIKGTEVILEKIKECIDKQPGIEPSYKVALYYNYLDIASLKNDFNTYKKYFKLYDDAMYEVIDKENRDKEYNATIRFETDQKNAQIDLLTATSSLRKKLNYVLVSLFGIILLTMFFMFRSYKSRQREQIIKQELLQKQKEEAELYAKLQEQEAKQVGIEKQMEQQQKEQFQKQFMTSILQMERKNEILTDLKSTINENEWIQKSPEIKKINKIIDHGFALDDDFENFKMNFENVYPSFFTQLQQKAQGELSQLDLKYCAYINMGLSNKEIANLLHIEPTSVRMTRYRLKQKLALEKEEDLNGFISTLS